MPSIVVYLNQAEYMKLCHRAENKNLRASLLARKYIQKGLREPQK